jgi:hypothetical protein
MELTVSPYGVCSFTLWGHSFNLWRKPQPDMCAVTFKVKVSLRWIQQLAMRASAFDESKYPDRMKVPAHICA